MTSFHLDVEFLLTFESMAFTAVEVCESRTKITLLTLSNLIITFPPFDGRLPFLPPPLQLHPVSLLNPLLQDPPELHPVPLDTIVPIVRRVTPPSLAWRNIETSTVLRRLPRHFPVSFATRPTPVWEPSRCTSGHTPFPVSVPYVEKLSPVPGSFRGIWGPIRGRNPLPADNAEGHLQIDPIWELTFKLTQMWRSTPVPTVQRLSRGCPYSSSIKTTTDAIKELVVRMLSFSMKV